MYLNEVEVRGDSEQRVFFPRALQLSCALI